MFISRPRLGFLFALLLALLGPTVAAHAQQIVAIVNGDPITSYDVAQRQKLGQMVDRQNISAKAALDSLIEQRIKIQQARRFQGGNADEEGERIFKGIAQRSGRTPEQFAAGLQQSGVDPRAFKDRLTADYIWNQYVRSRSATANVQDADVAAALQQRGATQNTATEFVLRPIIFVVPRSARNHGARLREANALKARFRGCDSGLKMARSLKEVVVRPPATRLSSDMPPALYKILDKTPEGQLTPPEVTQNGVETFAICTKRTVRGESSAKQEVKNELSDAQFKKASTQLMNELRKGAMIQYRR